jgi:hypothetical protein
VTGKRRCAPCNDIQLARQRSWHAKQRNLGLCVACRGPAETGRSYCWKHGQQRALQKRIQYARRVPSGQPVGRPRKFTQQQEAEIRLAAAGGEKISTLARNLAATPATIRNVLKRATA